MKLKPIRGHVAFRMVELPEETIGGIIIPQSARQPENQGTVVAIGDREPVRDPRPLDIGPGMITELLDTTILVSPVAVGDHIVVDTLMSVPVAYDGEDLYIIHVDHIAAVLT